MSERGKPKVISHKWFGHGVCLHEDDDEQLAVDLIRKELMAELNSMPATLRDSVEHMLMESIGKLRVMDDDDYADGELGKRRVKCKDCEDRVHVTVTNLSKGGMAVVKQLGSAFGKRLTEALSGRNGRVMFVGQLPQKPNTRAKTWISNTTKKF